MLIHNQDFKLPKTQLKRNKAIPRNQTISFPSLPTIPQLQLQRGTIQDALHEWHQSLWDLAYHPTHVLDLGLTRSIGSRMAVRRFQKYALYCGITTEVWPCHESLVFANSETGTCSECCITNSPITSPCSTRVDVRETGDVPILVSLPQKKILGMTIEHDPKKKNYVSSFWLVLFAS